MKLVKSIVFLARNRENDPAIAYPGGVATYGALMKSVASAVEALRTFELAPGSAVMLDIRNPIHHTAMIFALALLGLPSASIGTTFVAEKAGFLPKLFLTDRDGVTMAGVRVMQVDDRWFVSDPGARPDYRKLLALPGFTSPDSIVRFVYSSGTTGHPKCVALTQACIELRAAHSSLSSAWWMSGPASLSMMGFSTIVGIMAPLSAHMRGSVLCYAGNYTDALQMLQMFRVSALVLAVGQFQALYKVFGDHSPPLSSVKLLAIVGAKIPKAMLTEARARICSTVMFGYGSTEMGGISSGMATSLDTPEGFAGYVQPWAEIEAVDDDRRVIPAGTEGVLRIRTPELAFYVDAEGRPVDMLEDGWFYPGDIGTVTEDGQLLITGRSTEIINKGGIVVAPDAIEEVLRLDKRVADVAVVGVVNASGLEEIWAAVVADTLIDPGAIIEAARPRLNEKVPDRVIQVSEIPRAESAKVRRNALRETLKAKLGV
ncbi:MAG: class I adenylate-forming enzyme family protein [Devosia sp.]